MNQQNILIKNKANRISVAKQRLQCEFFMFNHWKNNRWQLFFTQ